ncbi:DUF58 domain-containing protein [Clostridium omnivorum]|uniref:DUF58 domain-containing protein n=1 Tax=Clostridium omnivorum TaxID=1604902 RepID=A0ABQ5N3W8_9CLOT|nr:DUF58 domain-containing protein [Clostridium sp. E14]GLC29917.1 hypothetical protein bsdE14_13270 [Clostridium sp. E14]
MEEKIFDSEFLKKLQTISLSAKIAMNEGAGGSRKSKAKGSSVEFSDYREYAHGDDFRRIDWNAYGRFDKLFVKLFMEEREALVNIFIDSSKSMDFGEPKKSITALRLAAIFSFLSLNNMDRVCINGIKGNFLNQHPTLTGKAMFNRCISLLQDIDFSGTADINTSIKKKELHSRGICIIISDFFSESGIEEAVKYLRYKNQEVILVQILSEEELMPELQGQLRLVDSETLVGRSVAVTSSILKEYNKRLDMFLGNIKAVSSKFGAAYVQICSKDSIEKVIFEDLARAGAITF